MKKATLLAAAISGIFSLAVPAQAGFYFEGLMPLTEAPNCNDPYAKACGRYGHVPHAPGAALPHGEKDHSHGHSHLKDGTKPAADEKTTKPATNAKPKKPGMGVKPVKPAQDVKPVKPLYPVLDGKPAKPVKPVKDVRK